ncbi:MAG: flagellar export chaperone FliS [Bryobacterales bacterium]|nr:flagellar export chaperone FliS [Bryobacterales bacterium]
MNPYRNQIEQDILSAEPLELVVILYSGLRDSIVDARRQLAKRDTQGRAASISKAVAIVGELAATLDLNRGGELAIGLNRLYSYLVVQLLDGNYRQEDRPLAEAESVVTALLEAWTAIRPTATPFAEIPAYPEAADLAEAASWSVCG